MALKKLSASFFASFAVVDMNGRAGTAIFLVFFLNLILLPFVLTGCVVLFYFIPKIDPLKKNIKKFQNHYESFILVLTLYLFYINALTVTWNLGYRFDLNVFMIASISFLFIYIAS